MVKTIPYPPVPPFKQTQLYCLLNNYEHIYEDLRLESIVVYGDNFVESDDWAGSLLGLDMGVIAMQIYHLFQVISYYAQNN